MFCFAEGREKELVRRELLKQVPGKAEARARVSSRTLVLGYEVLALYDELESRSKV